LLVDSLGILNSPYVIVVLRHSQESPSEQPAIAAQITTSAVNIDILLIVFSSFALTSVWLNRSAIEVSLVVIETVACVTEFDILVAVHVDMAVPFANIVPLIEFQLEETVPLAALSL